MEQKNHRILEKSMEILEYISKNPEGKLLSEITKLADLPKSSVHNILQTFANLGYLYKDKKTNTYTLGLKSFELGVRYTDRDELFRSCKEVLKKMTDLTDETAHFAILDNTEVVYIYKNESTQPIRMVSKIGNRNYAHATSLGKVLLSGLTDDEIIKLYEDKPLKSITENTITDLNVLLNQIKEIRLTGIGYESEESTPNVQCVAVPIKQKNGKVIAAMSISIPIFRVGLDLSKYINALKNGAKELENYSI